MHPTTSLWGDLASVVIRPRRTIRRIIDTDPNRHIKSIFFLAIISAIIKDFDLQGLDDVAPVSPLLIFLYIMGGIAVGIAVMLLAYYVLSWSATLVGQWIGGHGRFRQVRAAIAWGLAPIIWALVYRIPVLLIALISGNGPGPPRILVDGGRVEWNEGTVGAFDPIWFVLFVLLDGIVLLWYLIISSRTLGEAHQFSSWKGFGTLLLAFIFPFAAIATLAFVGWIYMQRLG